ncbi:dihydroxyacetone kinase [Microdochium bolleyi]|uniref:Dihydroxyacetone kinase n=1 Tax=Microdochium bolleyi TaxID=196109 RepID=A0A136J7R9_9PEZI|nr:dihydroxyacetone kinase [Microdochium bolleyi]
MAAKHFINDPTLLVNSALESLTLTNPSVALDSKNKIIYRRPNPNDAQEPQVSIISGGGSGHEPSFGAFVGRGLLSAAVMGTIFASPSAEQVRAAITSRVDTEKGVLVILMNYTGDILNFAMAVEKAKAAGVSAEMVVVGDDVGVGRAKGGKVGRRGIAGTVLVHKIAGALAVQGASLEQVHKVAKLTAENLVSVGASLDHVHVPGREVSSQQHLADGEVEIGMGIHNEAGSEQAKLDLPQLVKKMLAQLLDQNDKDRAFLNVNSNEVVLLVNNLGGVSVLELGGITAEVVKQLRDWGVQPVRILSGTYMTSLNGLGFSISLLNVVNTDIGGPSMIRLLDYPCEATGWAAPICKETWEARNTATRDHDDRANTAEINEGQLKTNADEFLASLSSALKAVIAAEPEVTRYDTVVGDGDCGIGLKRGAEAVLKHVQETAPTGDVIVDVARIVTVVEDSMDGTSGALFAIFLNALVHALRSAQAGDATPQVWAKALRQSSEALSKYTPARPGDRTLVDSLYPFVDKLEETGGLAEAAEAAKQGALKTKGMHAALGRAVYVGESRYDEVPDPGAWGLAVFFLGLAGLQSREDDGLETI